jgi:hypothetical protein
MDGTPRFHERHEQGKTVRSGCQKQRSHIQFPRHPMVRLRKSLELIWPAPRCFGQYIQRSLGARQRLFPRILFPL